jgi:hypothetical protein
MKCGIALIENLAGFFTLFDPHTAPAAVALRVMKDVGALPLPAAIAATLRPEAIDLGSVRRASPSPSRASSSRCLSSSQLVRLPPLRSFLIRTSTQPPCSRSPSKENFRSPRFNPSCGSPSGIQ